MSNAFVDIVEKASQFRWCTQPYCTTCGNHEVRVELSKIAGEGGLELASQLSKLSPSEIARLPNWEDCIRLAFFEIPIPGLQEKVLESWLCTSDIDVHFADVVLFYVIRGMPFGGSIGNQWIQRCVLLAIDTKNESLTESLLWTLKTNVYDYPAFLIQARMMASSPIIAKALAAYGSSAA